MKWVVEDSYNKVVHTNRTLRGCGIWIDPILGIDFRGHPDSEDIDRVTKQDDGSYVVKMYDGPGGMGGELTVRKA